MTFRTTFGYNDTKMACWKEKGYKAISPIGQEGNIYIFDAESIFSDGFEVGASLEAGEDATTYQSLIISLEYPKSFACRNNFRHAAFVR
ncbi:hypothetical protein [Autumnicola psychrophila]|uniref:Uncharacterized protein n=1 Tax=Autumnicola psychrophila TaxID=3075592 RepID=A0ABU3DRJ5_9FLAO|nr:hypothetical protein [Zunongwangia sp. F225]MDT0686334.1 hypothetical protein [Zunongwangia sp. F225]